MTNYLLKPLFDCKIRFWKRSIPLWSTYFSIVSSRKIFINFSLASWMSDKTSDLYISIIVRSFLQVKHRIPYSDPICKGRKGRTVAQNNLQKVGLQLVNTFDIISLFRIRKYKFQDITFGVGNRNWYCRL